MRSFAMSLPGGTAGQRPAAPIGGCLTPTRGLALPSTTQLGCPEMFYALGLKCFSQIRSLRLRNKCLFEALFHFNGRNPHYG